MKHTFKYILSALLCLSLLLAAVPTTVYAVTDGGFDGEENVLTSDPFTVHLARDGLATLPNAEALLYAYDAIVAGVEVCAQEITVGNGSGTLSKEEIALIVDAYRRDRADHFWLGSSYSMRGTSETITTLLPTYTMTGETLAVARTAFEGAISHFMEGVTLSESEFDRELLLHDRLAAHVTYTLDAPNAYNAYGALVEGAAVCEGYAEAFQVLLHRARISSVIVFGASVNPSTGLPEGHAWNMVRIDGNYYHADLTWNDQEAYTYHAYFNQTDAMITEDHTVDPTPYALPACTATEAFYFNVKGGVLSEYTAQSVGARLADDNLCTSVYITGDRKEFSLWYMENGTAIATAAGVHGSFKYGYAPLGREYLLTIDACLHREMTYVPATPVGCVSNGNRAYYVCTCGRWFEDAAAEREIYDHDNVILRALGHLFTDRIEDALHLRALAADCCERDTYWLSCSKCREISTDAFFESATRGAHVHPLTPVPAVEPTCLEAGQSAYYVCVCGDAFADAAGNVAISDPGTYGKTAALGHADADGNGACDRCNEDLQKDASGGAKPIAPLLIVAAVGAAVLIVSLVAWLLFRRRR